MLKVDRDAVDEPLDRVPELVADEAPEDGTDDAAVPDEEGAVEDEPAVEEPPVAVEGAPEVDAEVLDPDRVAEVLPETGAVLDVDPTVGDATTEETYE